MHTIIKPFLTPCKTRIAFSFLTLGVMVFALAGVSEARRDSDDEKWQSLERQVKDSRFPEDFLDSLSRANGITDNRGLAKGKILPFKNREKLVFDGGWGSMRAGYLVVNAHKDHENKTMDITGKVATNGFVSAIFKIRDFVFSRMDADGLYPLHFEHHVREGRHRDRGWTLFDHKRGSVFSDDDKGKASKASPFTHNYMSLIYYLRTMDLAPGDTFSINCFVHDKDYPIHFKVHGREKVKVDAGTFECLKLEPTLVGDGRGFAKGDKMYIWITDDNRRMPVMLESEMGLGSLSAKLVYYESE